MLTQDVDINPVWSLQHQAERRRTRLNLPLFPKPSSLSLITSPLKHLQHWSRVEITWKTNNIARSSSKVNLTLTSNHHSPSNPHDKPNLHPPQSLACLPSPLWMWSFHLYVHQYQTSHPLSYRTPQKAEDPGFKPRRKTHRVEKVIPYECKHHTHRCDWYNQIDIQYAIMTEISKLLILTCGAIRRRTVELFYAWIKNVGKTRGDYEEAYRWWEMCRRIWNEAACDVWVGRWAGQLAK